ncbi:hypothetical protein THAOC_24835, partial [Thalassiosira oceanica]
RRRAGRGGRRRGPERERGERARGHGEGRGAGGTGGHGGPREDDGGPEGAIRERYEGPWRRGTWGAERADSAAGHAGDGGAGRQALPAVLAVHTDQGDVLRGRPRRADRPQRRPEGGGHVEGRHEAQGRAGARQHAEHERAPPASPGSTTPR